MNRSRIASARRLLPVFVALSTMSLVITGASASTSANVPARGTDLSVHATNRCDVVPQVGVHINASVFPCVVTVSVGKQVRLVFDTGWRWSNPQSTSAAIEIRTISSTSTGVKSATVVAMKVGVAKVSMTGTIICKSGFACSDLARLWLVRFQVTRSALTAHTVRSTNVDDGRGFTLHVGDHFVLDLTGSTLYSWTSPVSTNATSLRLDSSEAKSGNVTAVFTARSTGVSRVSADENPNCYPQCLPPSRLFHVNVTVVP